MKIEVMTDKIETLKEIKPKRKDRERKQKRTILVHEPGGWPLPLKGTKAIIPFWKKIW